MPLSAADVHFCVGRGGKFDDIPVTQVVYTIWVLVTVSMLNIMMYSLYFISVVWNIAQDI